MNCQDFDRLWNELLDASSELSGDHQVAVAIEIEHALREHAASCAACSRRSAGYQMLERTLLAWGKGPEPPAGLADRILTAASTPLATSRYSAGRSRLVGSKRLLFAAAAAVLAMTAVGLISRFDFKPARDLRPRGDGRAQGRPRAVRQRQTERRAGQRERGHLGPCPVGVRAGR